MKLTDMAWWNHFTYWKMAFFKALLYMLVVGATDFLTNTETWSQETWDNTGPFIVIRMFCGVAIAMLTVMIAFLDSTMSNLKNGKLSSGDTTTFVRKD